MRFGSRRCGWLTLRIEAVAENWSDLYVAAAGASAALAGLLIQSLVWTLTVAFLIRLSLPDGPMPAYRYISRLLLPLFGTIPTRSGP